MEEKNLRKSGFNNAQKSLLAVYLPMTGLILAFDRLYAGEDAVQYVKYALMISLSLSVWIVQKAFREQRLMSLSFVFLVVADFFLVFSETLHNLGADVTPFGIAGFLLAYLCLIGAYRKKFRLSRPSLLSAVPVFLVFGCVFVSLRTYVGGVMLADTLVFGIVLCVMTWTAVCTMFSGYYRKSVSKWIALSGVLMFICDMAVAFSLFHPDFAGAHTPWLNNVIWGAYVPGWTLLAVVINEKDLINSSQVSETRNTPR